MFKRDSMIVGIIQGIVFPALFFFIFLEVNELLIKYYFGENATGISKRFIAILSIGTNLIPITLANKQRNTITMRGIMTSTLILTAVVVVYFWQDFKG